jgi:trigger factor
MNIELNEIEFCKLLIKYEADPDVVISKRNEVINHFKEKDIPGFRKGKATKDIVKYHFNKEIKESLTKELANEAVQNVIDQKNIKPFGYPSFNSVSLEENNFKCEFVLHQKPDVALATYKGFDIPKPPPSISMEEFAQKILQELRTRYGQTSPYGENDFVSMGDNVILDFKAFVDGNVLDNVGASGQLCKVGDTGIPGFDHNLIGMKPSDEREFYLKIPESFKSEKMAGKNVKFQVKLMMGAKIVPAALDDDLAKSVGLNDYNALMEQVNMMASSRIKEIENSAIIDQVSKRIVDNHECRVPEWISIAEAKMNAKNNKSEWDSLSDDERKKYIDGAIQNVRLSLVLEKVRDEEPSAQLTDEEVFKIAQEEVAKYSQEPNKAIQEMYNNGYLNMFFNRIRDDYTLDFIRKTCNITE